MAYVEELLGRGEQIVYESRQHIVVLVSRILTELGLIALLVAAGVASAAFNEQRVLGMPASDLILTMTFVISLIVLFSAFWDYFRWTAEQYILTDRRVIQVRGVLNKTIIDSSLSKINDIALSQNLIGRTLDFGTLEILTGSQETNHVMKDVASPFEFKRLLQEAKYQHDHGYGYLEAHHPAAPAAAAPAAPHPAAVEMQHTLAELARLRDRGILSSDEFEAKKREILSRMSP